jgi:hypothetical protein
MKANIGYGSNFTQHKPVFRRIKKKKDRTVVIVKELCPLAAEVLNR